MKLGLLAVAVAVGIHLTLGLLQASGFLSADGRWFEGAVRSQRWQGARTQRHVSKARSAIRRWLASPESGTQARALSMSLDEAYYGISSKLPPVSGAGRHLDGAYLELSKALESCIRESDRTSLDRVREACREMDAALEVIGELLAS